MPVPLVQAGPARSGAARLWAAGVLACAAAVLGVAAWLRPDPSGYGTHAQLTGAPCGLLVSTGYPCPTCGMTTAFAYTVRGQWGRAFLAQPAGFVLALCTIAAAGSSGWILVRGRWPAFLFNLAVVHGFFIALLVILLGGWVLKLVLGLLNGTLPMR